MAEFWEADAVVTTKPDNADWWKKDAVVGEESKASPAPKTEAAAAIPTTIDHRAEAEANLARGPYTPKGIQPEFLPEKSMWEILTLGIPMPKVGEAENITAARDVMARTSPIDFIASWFSDSAKERLNAKLGDLPTRTTTTGEKVLAGALNKGSEVPEAMTSLIGLATLGTAGAVPAVHRAIAGAFFADIAHKTPDRVVDVYEALKLDLGPQKATEAMGGLMLDAAFLKATGSAALKAPATVATINPAVEAAAAAGGRVLSRGTTDPLLDPLAGSRVRQTDVTPLEVAAVKAAESSAPATAAALESQAIILKDVQFPKTPEPVMEVQVKAGELERGQSPFKTITVEPDGTFSVAETRTTGSPIIRSISIPQIIEASRGAVRENPEGGKVSFAAEAPVLNREALGPKNDPVPVVVDAVEAPQQQAPPVITPEKAVPPSAASMPKGKPVEQMTPEEFKDFATRDPIRSAAVQIRELIFEAGSHPEAFDKAAEYFRTDNLEPQREGLWVTKSGRILTHQDGIDTKFGDQKTIIERKIDRQKQVSASASEASGIKLPEGWTQRGDIWYPPERAAKSAPEISQAELWADKKISEGGKRLNTGLDPELLAAYVVKGGAVLARGAIRFKDWSAEMVRQFGEDIRPHLDDLYTKAIQYRDSIGKLAKPAEPTAITETATAQPKTAKFQKPSRPLGEIYSEPLAERIRRLGGPVANQVANEALQIADKAKRLYGDLSDRVLDSAKRSAGKAFRGGTTWIQGKENVTDKAATSRFHNAIEEHITTGNWNHIPARVRPLAQELFDANLEIGRLAQQANPGFQATGKVQRMLTSYGHDVVMRGRGPAWEAWAEGLAKANGKTVPQVKAFLRRWKGELDKPGVDAAGLDRISQDFVREFPKVITHIRPLAGWHEVVHSSPFQYLEQAAQRTANAVAFREVYPVGSGMLDATRKAVQRELATDTHKNEFDNLMRGLQGHPTDQLTSGFTAPDTLLGAASRTAGQLSKPIRSSMLSQSVAVNIGETISGGAQIFLGYDTAMKAAAQRGTLYRDLERNGAVNQAIRDFSFDPTSPLKSTARYVSNLISRGFLNDMANEFQEYTGAASAKLVVDSVRNGTITPAEKTLLANAMRASGIPKVKVLEAVEGRNPEALSQFETKAAEFLSAGNQLTAEKSRLGSSRAFNELFWFHSYPMSKVRQARSILNNIVEDASTKDWRGVYTNSKLMGRFLGGTTLAGAVTTGALALIGTGLYGLGIKKREAQDDFGDFAKESFLMGFGGPVALAAKIFEDGGDLDAASQGVLNAVTPYSMSKELSDAAMGKGRYEGMDASGRVAAFVSSKTPGLKPFKLGMASYGLSQDDPKLDAASRAFYRWRKDKFGGSTHKSHLKEDADRKAFRGHMKQAVEALKDGDMNRFEERLDLAADKAESGRAIKQSFDSRKMLRSPNGKKLTPEEMDELRARIGDEPVERLENFDATLEALSR